MKLFSRRRAYNQRTVPAAFGITDPGRVRKNNEDAFLIDEDLGLFLVADGMGGAQAGERASRLAVDAVRDHLRQAESRGAEDLIEAFEAANRNVMGCACGDVSLEGMGTTLVGALRNGGDLYICSVGDSRAYLYEFGHLQAITEDQTWVNEVGRRLGLDETVLKTHPMRHVLTMAIGVSDPLRVHSYLLRPSPGCQIMLSSDGLHGVVAAEAMASVLGSGQSLETKCQMLIDAARDAGGPDNITSLLLQY